MPLKYCPVCEEIGEIGYAKKTCSSECGRAWVKMSRAEQKVRMTNANLTDAERVEELKAAIFGANKSEATETIDEAEPFDRGLVDPSLHMPKGILPDEEDK